MTQNYTKNLKIHPCVFHVPQNIKDTKPEAYTPQIVGLGPYHHFRQQVQQMEIQKRDAVRTYINRDEFTDFIQLVKQMTTTTEENNKTASLDVKVPENIREKFESTVRCSYDSYLDLQGRTLSWIMVVDGIFLLHVVKNYYGEMINKNSTDNKISSGTEKLVQEILMLENQIPLEVLRLIKRALKRSFTGSTDIDLYDKFTYLCTHNSPLKLSNDPEIKKQSFKNHILHHMYRLILENDVEARWTSTTSSNGSPENSGQRERGVVERMTSRVTGFFQEVQELVSSTESSASDIVRLVGESVESGFQQMRVSGVKIPSNVEKASKILQELAKTSNLFAQSSINNPRNQKGVVMEIDVPTVSKLHKIAKMEFVPTEGGLQSLFMDWENNTLRLPVITLKANSEIVLRNLVAYELAVGSSLELTEYVDLMCGIIDTEKDVELLKQKKIIEGDLGNDEILGIFNGINKSMMESLDEVNKGSWSKVQKFVKEANEMFGKIWIVKAFYSFRKFIARFQDVRGTIFQVLVLILLSLQYVCDIRGCSGSRRGWTSNWEYYNSLPPAAAAADMGSDSKPDFLMMPRKLMLQYSSP